MVTCHMYMNLLQRCHFTTQKQSTIHENGLANFVILSSIDMRKSPFRQKMSDMPLYVPAVDTGTYLGDSRETGRVSASWAAETPAHYSP